MLVDQTPYLFSCSIAENISFALPDATREQSKRQAAPLDWMN